MQPPPRPNQVTAFNGTLDAIKRGVKRLCVASPTGAGKTRMMTDMIGHVLSDNGTVTLYTQRRMLFEQTERVLLAAGVPFGRRASGYRPSPLKDVQLCMVQSEVSAVYKRQTRKLHKSTIALFDEPHQYGGKWIDQIMTDHCASGATCIGYTATPLDLADKYDELLVAGTPTEMRACGAMVRAITYAPDNPDLRHLKGKHVDGDDLTHGQNQKAMMRKGVEGRVIESYRAINEEQRPTLLFAPGIRESLFFAQEFTKAGIRACHIDGDDMWLDGHSYKSSSENRTEMMQAAQDGHIKVICNRYVCLDAETEILTDQGWLGIDDAIEDTLVANWSQGSVYFEEPREVIRRDRGPDERMVVLDSPRRSIRVTDSHELLYRTSRNSAFLKDTAFNLVGKRIQVPVSGLASAMDITIEQPDMIGNLKRRVRANAYALRRRGYDSDTSRDVAESRLRERAALKRKQPRELTEEECEFIGIWLGDGNSCSLQSGGIQYRLAQQEKYPAIIARVDDLIASMGMDVRRTVYNRMTTFGTRARGVLWSLCRGTGFGPQARRGLFPIEPYLEKDGSDLLWGLDELQFTALIRGLWMANGMPHHDRTGLPTSGLRICGVNRKLLDLLQAIAVCRGFRASVREYNNHGRPLFHLSLTKTMVHEIVSRHQLYVEDGWREERVWCVRTSSENIITRRRGSVTVMGNCREGIDAPWLSHGILATVFGSLTSYIQSGGRLLRAAPNKPFATIQDHGGNWFRHGSLNSDRAWDMALTNRRVVGERMERMREKLDPEPVTCPQCGVVRNGGRQCPDPPYGCGYLMTKKSRKVVQSNGVLRLVTGDVLRRRHVRMTPQTVRQWRDVYMGSIKCGRSFRAAEAWFFQKHGYYPPRNLPLMPLYGGDWWRDVKDVPRDRLIQPQATPSNLQQGPKGLSPGRGYEKSLFQ